MASDRDPLVLDSRTPEAAVWTAAYAASLTASRTWWEDGGKRTERQNADLCALHADLAVWRFRERIDIEPFTNPLPMPPHASERR